MWSEFVRDFVLYSLNFAKLIPVKFVVLRYVPECVSPPRPCPAPLQAVVCGEVSTLAVSENCNDINNCFLLWGSPPVTSTSLTSLLKQAAVKGVANGNHGNKLDAPKLSEVESGVPQRGKPLVGANDPPPLLSPILPHEIDLSDPYKSDMSNDGNEQATEGKLSDKSVSVETSL